MDWTIEFDKAIEQYLPDLEVLQDEPMSRHTTFRIGGPAKRMAFPSSREQLVLLMSFAKNYGANPLVIGNGSNLLVPDEGLARTADLACKSGLTGLEFAHGIPGTVGGGVCMNAGAYGGEMKQVLRSAAVLFPEEGIRTLSCEELNLSYRHSLLTEHPEAVVLYAEFELTPGDPEAIRAAMRELMAKRKASQPLEWPSAGSTFKRPEGHFAGTLIDQCGLKGLTVGGAQVSEKHAGFLINRGGATFADMAELIRQVQQRVLEETGVTLEPEVKIVK